MDRQVPEPSRQRDDNTDLEPAEPAVTTGAGAPFSPQVQARFESLVPARLDEATLLRRKFAAWLEWLPLDFDSRIDIVLAGYEAVGNAAMHADPGRRGRIRLYAHWAGDMVKVVVTDWGCGIAAKRDRVTALPASGHSLSLIDDVTDQMTVDTGEHGTRVTMLWRPATLRENPMP